MGVRLGRSPNSSTAPTTGLASVDIGDIDVAGIAALAARRFGPAFLEQLAERVGPVGATPILAGLDLASGNGGAFTTY